MEAMNFKSSYYLDLKLYIQRLGVLDLENKSIVDLDTQATDL